MTITTKFNVGQIVYYLTENGISHGQVQSITLEAPINQPCEVSEPYYKLRDILVLRPETKLWPTPDGLLNYIKANLHTNPEDQ